MMMATREEGEQMEMFSCGTLKKVVCYLMGEEELQGKIFVAGGIVPWLLSGKDSGRQHGDIDLVVKMDDMDHIRRYLKKHGLYGEESDSRFLSCNKGHADHGVEVFFHQIPINFAPFERVGGDIIQRNFSLERFTGFDALMTATITNLAVEDYITTYRLDDGTVIGAYTLETVLAAKEQSDREKDRIDRMEIASIGIDRRRYARVKPAIQSMKIDVFANE